MEKPKPINLYLGCLHEQHTIKLKHGTTVRAVVYNMESYLRSTLDKYIKMASDATGTPVKLRKFATPDLPDDQKFSPMGMPAATGPCTECPWCRHTFPTPNPSVITDAGGEGSKSKKRKKAIKSQSDPETNERGRLSSDIRLTRSIQTIIYLMYPV